MIILGIILLVIGFLIGFQILEILGVILLVVGVVLLVAGRTGHEVRGRKHYW